MRQKVECVNHTDLDDNPAGGEVSGTGISIQWQNGPLGRGVDRKEPNGAFVEDVLEACRKRLKFYQASKFDCRENALAINHIEHALEYLDKRTKDREARGIEGEHKV